MLNFHTNIAIDSIINTNTGSISSGFYTNYEAAASEFIEDLEHMFSRYYMDRYSGTRLKSLTLLVLRGLIFLFHI